MSKTRSRIGCGIASRKCPVKSCKDKSIMTRAKLAKHLKNPALHTPVDLLEIGLEPWYIFKNKTK